jgi:hypothetical protein
MGRTSIFCQNHLIRNIREITHALIPCRGVHGVLKCRLDLLQDPISIL